MGIKSSEGLGFCMVLKKSLEACSLNITPTTSTSMMLILGDAIALSLLKMKGFNYEDFKI